MGVSSTEFQQYLSADEPVRNAGPGSLIDGSYRSEGTICLTDRRVLFVTNGGEFLDAAYDSIDSIQCRRRTTLTYGSIVFRLFALLGVLVAVAGTVGIVAREPSALAIALVLVAIGGAVAAEYVRRTGVGFERTVANGARGFRDRGSRAIDAIRRDGGSARHDDRNVLLVLGIAFVSLSAMVGLVVHTRGLVVLPLTLVTFGGLALADYAHRYTKALERTGVGRRYERDLRIHLVGGRIVHLRVDDGWPIDRELSEAARGVEGG